MACIWVLALCVVCAQSSLAAHLHGKTEAAHRRTLHTTEGHDHRPGEPLPPEDLPVALPRVTTGHAADQSVPIALTKASRNVGDRTWPSKNATSSRRKREPRAESRSSSAAVLGELGKILKDDEAEAKRIPPDVKRQVDLKANETIDEAGNEKKQQAFEDWLRDEYLRNMALTAATVKKKRSSFDSRRKRSNRHEDANGVVQEAKLKLQSLENAVLADALSEIVSRGEDGDDDEGGSDSDLVSRRLAQAYYLERLRGAVQRIVDETSQRESWGEFDDERQEPEEEEYQPVEEDLYSYEKKDGNGLSSVFPVMAQVDDRRQNDEEMCPALRMLTSDCAILEELLSEGEMSLAVRHACNKHEVCYSCGEAFGLSASSCDRVFLEDVRTACHSCSERALGKLLIPLHDQRVFYKRSVPPLCFRSTCVQRFLEEHY